MAICLKRTLLENIKKVIQVLQLATEGLLFESCSYSIWSCLLKFTCLPLSIFVKECLFFEWDHDVILAMIQHKKLNHFFEIAKREYKQWIKLPMVLLWIPEILCICISFHLHFVVLHIFDCCYWLLWNYS